MFLVDINVFLEILLNQNNKEECKRFLENNSTDVYITDFSFHSIGVICFRYGKEEMFQKFIDDMLPTINLITLPLGNYSEVIENRKALTLDFDDSYQYTVAKYFDLKIVTMDNDFKKVMNNIVVLFL